MLLYIYNLLNLLLHTEQLKIWIDLKDRAKKIQENKLVNSNSMEVNFYKSTGWDYTASVDILSWSNRSLSNIFAAPGQCCQCLYNGIICIIITLDRK